MPKDMQERNQLIRPLYSTHAKLPALGREHGTEKVLSKAVNRKLWSPHWKVDYGKVPSFLRRACLYISLNVLKA